jgi:hypothetical protein
VERKLTRKNNMIQKSKTLGEVTVTTAGTRVQITSSDITAVAVVIQALPTNTGNIFVGDSTVASTNGLILTPGDIIVIDPEEENELNLSDVYVDAATNADKVRVAYMTVRGA